MKPNTAPCRQRDPFEPGLVGRGGAARARASRPATDASTRARSPRSAPATSHPWRAHGGGLRACSRRRGLRVCQRESLESRWGRQVVVDDIWPYRDREPTEFSCIRQHNDSAHSRGSRTCTGGDRGIEPRRRPCHRAPDRLRPSGARNPRRARISGANRRVGWPIR